MSLDRRVSKPTNEQARAKIIATMNENRQGHPEIDKATMKENRQGHHAGK